MLEIGRDPLWKKELRHCLRFQWWLIIRRLCGPLSNYGVRCVLFYYHLWTTKDYHTCVTRHDCFLYLRGYLYINNTLNSTMYMDKSTEGTNRPLGVLYGFRPRLVRTSWLLAILPCFLVCASNGDRQDRRNRNG